MATLPLLFAFLLFIFVLAKSFKKSKALSINGLPPGPPKLPIIGNLHQLTGPLPHVSMTNLAKKYGPVMHLQLGQRCFVVVSSLEAATEVLKTKEANFAQRPEFLSFEILGYGDSGFVFAPYGDYWRQMRKVCVLELLNAKRVQSFRSIREEESWDLIDSISSKEGLPVNLTHKIHMMTNNIIFRAAFGKKCKDQDEYLSASEEALKIGEGLKLADLFPSFTFLRYVNGMQPAMERLHKKFDKILQDIINEHKDGRGRSESSMKGLVHEDILDVLLRLQEDKKLEMDITTDHIKALCMELFSAGSHTTSTAIVWVLSDLIKNPRVMHKAQAEVRRVLKGKTKIREADIQDIGYLKLVIKETMRLHSPAPIMPRECRETCEIGGYKIPAKARVMVNTGAISKDPSIWVEPDEFRPERFQGSQVDFKGTNFELIPFGAGRRLCPGIAFATTALELALAQLLYHFDWKLPNGLKCEDLDMTETYFITAMKKHDLEAVPIIRIPLSRS